jgi:hypothetical protein
MELSLTQTQHKGDVTPGFAPQQTNPKPLIGGFFCALERRCGKRDNYYAWAEPDAGR